MAININMRCIEIADTYYMMNWNVRLTLTWDVLKSVKGLSNSAYLFRLTLTWDVLKLRHIMQVYIANKININMRCIEIFKGRQ